MSAHHRSLVLPYQNRANLRPDPSLPLWVTYSIVCSPTPDQEQIFHCVETTMWVSGRNLWALPTPKSFYFLFYQKYFWEMSLREISQNDEEMCTWESPWKWNLVSLVRLLIRTSSFLESNHCHLSPLNIIPVLSFLWKNPQVPTVFPWTFLGNWKHSHSQYHWSK